LSETNYKGGKFPPFLLFMVEGTHMSKEMKLIMENWRRNVLNEQSTIQTVADLIKMLKIVTIIKKGGDVIEALGTVGVKFLSAFLGGADLADIKDHLTDPQKVLDKIVTGMGVVGDIKDVVLGAKSVAELVTNMTKLPDKKADKAGYLAMFDINDNYLKITDNKLENAIINNMISTLSNPQIQSMNISEWDINTIFQDALQKALGGDETVTGAPTKKVGTIAKKGKGDVMKTRAKQIATGAE
tara:strand:+ start:1597 stop:2322 length:726 start_codon:yes stop_codon:yes gene_type:complete